MRKLTDSQNIDPASSDYPNGRTRDKTVSSSGTIGSEILMGDIIQFFQKLVIDSGITENDLPDNVTNGYQLMEALGFRSGGLIKKVIDIGAWNMNSSDAGDESMAVNHGIVDFLKIRSVSAVIANDGDTAILPISIYGLTDKIQGAVGGITSVSVTLKVFALSMFDSIAFSSVLKNRGWLVIEYDNN